ncbi:hypothetical protein TRFO_37923 [Tritrichomonas foetus]|uniref:DOCKER Lobe A domain-containing protein n=1 Tax=Tritrichomonas foetus TaxID=1144522 RepID=A0A1J4J9W8_9EUKA|nr:hypothetical protein TRFO_37923 [Tritrichomonas foetus]|eukprot:OHS95952.1 hypothetical protein TRFO_37923 [Tritrichomonas foetus]
MRWGNCVDNWPIFRKIVNNLIFNTSNFILMSQCQYQLQLLSRIDGYKLAFQNQNLNDNLSNEKLNQSDFQSMHFLLSQEKPTTKHIDKLLPELISSEDIEEEQKKVSDIIPPDASDLKCYINENLSKIALLYAHTTILPDENEKKKIFDCINNIKFSMFDLMEETESFIDVYTPSQIIHQLSIILSKISNELNNVSIENPQFRELINTFVILIQTVDKIISKSQESCDLMLFSISDSELFNYRNQILNFSFLCGHLDQIVKLSFTKLVSELLYYFDYLIIYRNALPSTLTTPQSIAQSAIYIQSIIQSILNSSPSESINLVESPLIEISSLFDDITCAFSEYICLKPVVIRLISFFSESQNDFEFLFSQLLNDPDLRKQSNDLIIAYNQFLRSLHLLEYNESSIYSTNVGNIINSPITATTSLIEMKKQIDELTTPKNIIFELAELVMLFINPSTTVKSSEGTILHIKNDEMIKQLDEISQNIDNISKRNLSHSKVESLAKLSKNLQILGRTIDSLSNENPKIGEKYNTIIQKLNDKVFFIIDSTSQPINSMTAFTALRSIILLLESSLKMLDIAESSEINPKNDKKTIKQIIKGLNELIQHFNEPLLIANSSKIEKYACELTEIYNNADKYDNSSRECYIINILEIIFSLFSTINDLTSQMVVQSYDLIEVLNDLDCANNQLRDAIAQLAFGESSIHNKFIVKFISHQLDKISLLRYALTIAIPQQLVNPIAELRAQLDLLPGFVFPYGISIQCMNSLNYLSLARWKLCHLTEYYLYDTELKLILNDVTKELHNVQKAVKDETFKGNYSNILKTVDNIYSILGEFNERTGDEPTDYIDIFKTLIHQITKTWSKELPKEATSPMEKARQRLNDAIRLLHGDPVKIETFVNPVEQFGDSFLVPYLKVSISKSGGDDFFKAAMDAKGIDFPAGNEKLKKGMEILNNFINITSIPYDAVQSRLAAPMIYYVAAAKLMVYRQYKEFLDLAIAFMEAAPHELHTICFVLSYHFHKIYEKCAPNTIKGKDTIAQLLKINYMQHSNSNLADTAYYSTVFSTLIPKDHAPIFTVLTEPLRSCFHCRIQVRTVNFKEAIAYLNGIVPTQIRLSELKEIEIQQKEDEVIIPPSAKHSNNPDLDDDFDDGFQSQEIIITRDVQVLEPKKIASISATPSFQSLLSPVGSMIGGSLLVSGGGSILAALEEQSQLAFDSRVFEPSGTEITIPLEASYGPKTWKTYISATKDNSIIDSQNRESYYKDIWQIKPAANNGLRYNFIPYQIPNFQTVKKVFVNEFYLSEKDINAEENSINNKIIGKVMRAISASITKDPEILTTKLGNTFTCDFVPKKFKPFPQQTNFQISSEVPVACKKLKKVHDGDIVNPIKPEKSTHEELLSSSINSLSRFLDVISAYNVGPLVSFLSIFEKDELDPILLPWIYNNFSPKHYQKHFFSRYLVSVATFTRQVFLERSDNTELSNTLKALPYLMRIAVVSALAYSAKNPEVCVFSNTKSASSIYDFVDAISFIISCVASYAISKEINKQLLIFLSAIAPCCHELAFLATYNAYLRNLNNCEAIHFVGRFALSPLSAELMIAKFKLSSIRYFAPQKEFIIALANYNERILDNIISIASTIFSSNIQKLILQYISTFAEIAGIIENLDDKESISILADQFTSYINVVIHHYQSLLIRNYTSLAEQFLIPLLLTICYTPEENLINYFVELEESDKIIFINFLYSAMINILTISGSPHPFDELPPFKSRKQKIQYLLDQKIKTYYVNYTLFHEFTIRISKFLLTYLKHLQFSENLLPSATHLIISLMNRHQFSHNYGICAVLLAKLISKHSEIFYSHSTDTFSSIFSFCYKLLSRELRIARATCVAILVHLLYDEYMLNDRMTITELRIAEVHQFNLLSCSRRQVELLNILLIKIDLFTNSFSIKLFVEAAEKIIKRLLGIHSLVKYKLFERKSQDYQYRCMMRLADQFVDIPNERLKWLKEIVNFNFINGFIPQAFFAQMRVAALISRVLKLKGIEIPFSSIELPEDEDHIEIDENKSVYYDSPDFTLDGLNNVYIESLKYAIDASLIKQYSTIVSSLGLANSTPVEQIRTPQFYFLLGERVKGETVSMKIFSILISTSEEFLNFLFDEEIGMFPKKLKVLIFDSLTQAENNMRNGRFLISVQPESLVEFEGSSNIFYTDFVVPTESWDSISITRTFLKTNKPLPNAVLFVEAKKVVIRTITKKDLLLSKVKNAIDLLLKSRSMTRNLKGLVGISPLVHSLSAVFLKDNGYAQEILTAHHSGYKDIQDLAISLIQDVSETMNLYAEKVRDVKNAADAIDKYRTIKIALELFIQRLHLTGFSFVTL